MNVDMTQMPASSIQCFSETFFGNLLNSFPEPIVIKNREHLWVALNDAFCQFVGRDRQELINGFDHDFFPLQTAQQIWDADEQLLITGEAQRVERSLEFLSGEAPIMCQVQQVLVAGDQNSMYVANRIYPVPEQSPTHLEIASDTNPVSSRALIEAIPDLLIRMRADGTYLDLAFEGGYKPTAIAATKGKTIFDTLPPHISEQRMQVMRKALETGQLQIQNQELLIEGQLVYEEVRVIPNGKDEVLTMIRDVTDRRRAEIELQQLNEQLESQVEARTEALKKVVARLEMEISDRKKTEIFLQASETQLRQQTEELTQALQELRQTQMQLIQSEKMSGLGQLVAGVAHEINNPVNFIYGNLNYANDYTQDLLKIIHLYQQYYPTPIPALQQEIETLELDFLLEDLPKLLHSMRVGAERIQKIVASLRTFSRMDEAEMKSVSLPDCLDSTLMILQNRLKAKSDRTKIEIIKEYADLPPIECYAGQLNQVFMNILSNAVDALEDRMDQQQSSDSTVKPRITIRLFQPHANRVRIAIADNGLGIPEAVQARIFDPFFTTKPIGKGTGMGLSISYQIVTEKHRGCLSCHSTPGQGTEFAIEIPTTQAVIYPPG